jgi:hypothetical protein
MVCGQSKALKYTISSDVWLCIPCPNNCDYCFTSYGTTPTDVFNNYVLIVIEVNPDGTITIPPPPAPTANCKLCKSGFKLTSPTTCAAYTGSIVDCASYDSANKCLLCQNGKLLNPPTSATDTTQCINSCAAFGLKDLFCESCFYTDSGTICQKCVSGYVSTPNGCVPCGDGCSTCSERGQILDYTNMYMLDSTELSYIGNYYILNYQNVYELYEDPFCNICDEGNGNKIKKKFFLF